MVDIEMLFKLANQKLADQDEADAVLLENFAKLVRKREEEFAELRKKSTDDEFLARSYNL